MKVKARILALVLLAVMPSLAFAKTAGAWAFVMAAVVLAAFALPVFVLGALGGVIGALGKVHWKVCYAVSLALAAAVVVADSFIFGFHLASVPLALVTLVATFHLAGFFPAMEFIKKRRAGA